MDGTVIFATSRQKMEQKLLKLKKAADDIGVIIHPTKSKYMTVNTNDVESFIMDRITITYTPNYTYLGAMISADDINNQMNNHLQQKQAHVIKFSSFLTKNSDCPLHIKKQVLESALRSAIFYRLG